MKRLQEQKPASPTPNVFSVHFTGNFLMKPGNFPISDCERTSGSILFPKCLPIAATLCCGSMEWCFIEEGHMTLTVKKTPKPCCLVLKYIYLKGNSPTAQIELQCRMRTRWGSRRGSGDRAQLLTLELGWNAGFHAPSGKNYGMLEGYHNKHLTLQILKSVECPLGRIWVGLEVKPTLFIDSTMDFHSPPQQVRTYCVCSRKQHTWIPVPLRRVFQRQS